MGFITRLSTDQNFLRWCCNKCAFLIDSYDCKAKSIIKKSKMPDPSILPFTISSAILPIVTISQWFHFVISWLQLCEQRVDLCTLLHLLFHLLNANTQIVWKGLYMYYISLPIIFCPNQKPFLLPWWYFFVLTLDWVRVWWLTKRNTSVLRGRWLVERSERVVGKTALVCLVGVIYCLGGGGSGREGNICSKGRILHRNKNDQKICSFNKSARLGLMLGKSKCSFSLSSPEKRESVRTDWHYKCSHRNIIRKRKGIFVCNVPTQVHSVFSQLRNVKKAERHEKAGIWKNNWKHILDDDMCSFVCKKIVPCIFMQFLHPCIKRTQFIAFCIKNK